MIVTDRQIVFPQVPSARTKYVVLLAGLTETLLPVPTAVPPQEPVYHLQLALDPREPPFTLSVVLCPLQMVVVPVIDVPGNEVSSRLIVTDLQAVLLHVPSALTK